MPTLTLAAGWEQGTVAGQTIGVASAVYATASTGTPAVVTGRGATGYCLELNGTSAAQNVYWDTNWLGGTGKRINVGAVYIRIPTSLPTAVIRLIKIETLNDDFTNISYDNVSGKFQAQCANGTVQKGGPVIGVGEWHLIEWRYDSSAGTYKLDWRIDGVDMTQATGTATAADVTFLTLGWNTSLTAKIDFDDLVVSATTGDYPLGGHKIKLLKPDTAGTIIGVNTSNFKRFTNNGTIDSTFNSSNILTAISDVPPTLTASADGVVQNVVGTTSYIEIPMTTYTLTGQESVSGARMVSPCWESSATGAGTFGYRSWNTSVETVLFAAADRLGDNTSTPSWVCAMLTLADIDTQAEIDAMTMRVGFSGTVSPVPGFHAIYIELAVKEDLAVQKILNDSGTATDAGTFNAAVPLIDSGTATETINVPNAATLGESAIGRDTLAIAAAVTLPDGGIATDVALTQPSLGKTLADSATATDVGTAYLPPLTITTGGIYTGNYGSTDSAVAAITIATTQQVNLTRMNILHAGKGVTDSVQGTNVKITNCLFLRAKPAAPTSGQGGRAILFNNPASLVVEHCELQQGNGIWIGASTATCSPLRIRYNRCRDIGYYAPTDCCIQFFQADHMTMPAGEIAWNRTSNLHGFSQTEDNINIFVGSGVSGQPLDIHHNLIDGAWASDANGTGYTGGGIICGDSGGSFITIRNNWVVSTSNYGVSIVGGTGNSLLNNWVVNDALDQNGANHGPNYAVGVACFGATVTNATVSGNTSGWLQQNPFGTRVRNDYYTPQATTLTNNTSLPDPITSATEQAARDAWDAARQAAGIIVGIQPLGGTIAFGGASASGNFSGLGVTIDISQALIGSWVYCGIFLGATQNGPSTVAFPGWIRLLDDDEDAASHYAVFKRQKLLGDSTFSASWPVTTHGAWAWGSYTGQESTFQEERVSVSTGGAIDYNKLLGYFHATNEYIQLSDNTIVPTGHYAYAMLHWYIAGYSGAIDTIRSTNPDIKLLAYQNLAGMIVGPHSFNRPTSLVTQEEATAHGTGADSWRLHTPTVAISSSTNVTPPLFTTAAPHGLVVGDAVDIVGHSIASYNGYWVVASTPLTTTVTFTGMTANGAGTGGTIAKVIAFNDFSFLQAANISRASWITQASNHFASIKADGFDGVFFDDVNMFPGHGFNTGDPNQSTEFASDNAYRDAIIAAIAPLAPLARAQGLLVVPNTGMNPWDPNHYDNGYLVMLNAGSFDGNNREFWTNWYSGSAYFDGLTWSATMKIQTDTEAAGRFIMTNNYPLAVRDDIRSIRYGLASFYLYWDGLKASGFGYDDGRPLTAFHEYGKLIGTPTEAKQVVSGTTTDGAFMRHYTGGVVCVNAKTTAGLVTFNLGGTYLDPGGTPVTSIQLDTKNGMVLTTVPATPSSTVTTPTATPQRTNDWALCFFFNRSTTVGQVPSFTGAQINGLTIRESPSYALSSPFEAAAIADSADIVDTTPLQFAASSTWGTHGGAVLILLRPAVSNPVLSDSGSASDVLNANTATTSLNDSATASESMSILIQAGTTPTLTETATASESIAILRTVIVSELTTTVDKLIVTATATLSEAAVATDLQPKTLLESGTASDLLPQTFSEYSVATESVSIVSVGLGGSGLFILAALPTPDLALGGETLPFGATGFLPVTTQDNALALDYVLITGIPITLSDGGTANDGSGGGVARPKLKITHQALVEKVGQAILIERVTGEVRLG